MADIQITLQLFGAYRTLGEQLNITLPENSVVADIRTAVAAVIRKRNHDIKHWEQLLSVTHFATESELLQDNSPVPNNTNIAIIPPVAGG